MLNTFKRIPLRPLPAVSPETVGNAIRMAWDNQTAVLPIPDNNGSFHVFDIAAVLPLLEDQSHSLDDILVDTALHVEMADKIHKVLPKAPAVGDILIIVSDYGRPQGWTTVNECLIYALSLQCSTAKDLILRDQHIFLKASDSIYMAHKELFDRQRQTVIILNEDNSLRGVMTDSDISRCIEEGCDIWNTQLGNKTQPARTVIEKTLKNTGPLPPSGGHGSKVIVTTTPEGVPTGTISVEKLNASYSSSTDGNKVDRNQRRSTNSAPSETLILDTVLSSSLRTGIVGTDEYLNIIYFNEAIMDFLITPDEIHLGGEVWPVIDSCAISRNAFASYLENARNNKEQVIVNWVQINDTRRYIQCRLSTVDRQGHIAGYVFSIQDITAQRNAEDAIRRLAYLDKLTQLPNRLLFEERLDVETKRAKRNQTKFAIMMLDLDGFKLVNDEFGHTVGDELLCNVGKRLLSSVRETDTVARFGGDEFIFILPDIGDTEDVRTIAKKMREVIRKPYDLSGRPTEVDASIGFSIYPDDSTNPKDLLDQADARMYKNKRKEV